MAKPHKDAIAQEQLENQGYEVYRPLARRLKKQRGKQVKVLESLFPRYLFLQDSDDYDVNWSAIRNTIGLAGFVNYGKGPAWVTHHLIDSIKAREDDFSERSIDLDRFKTGQTIVIEDGPFKNMEGLFSSYDGDERAIVLLNFMNKETPYTIESGLISSR